MNKLQIAALVGAVVAVIATLIGSVLSFTVWGASEAYGRLAVPSSSIVHLPKATVDVAYEAYVPSAGDEITSIAIPDSLAVRIAPANGDGPPARLTQSLGATVAINDTVHRRIFRAAVPREADYRVTVRADTANVTDPALRLGHGGPWRRVLYLGIAVILVCVFIVITGGRWRRATMVGALALLAGCGGGGKAAKAPAPGASPTPPPSEQLKYDLLTAAIQLDAYRLSEKTFTADETKLGPAFPRTVTVKTADATSFYMAARDDKGVRYVLRRTGDVTERTCDPPTPDSCPDGRW